MKQFLISLLFIVQLAITLKAQVPVIGLPQPAGIAPHQVGVNKLLALPAPVYTSDNQDRIRQQNNEILREVELHQYMTKANYMAEQKGLPPPFPSPANILSKPPAEQQKLIALYEEQYRTEQMAALDEHNRRQSEAGQAHALAQEKQRRQKILAGMAAYQLPSHAQESGAAGYQQHLLEFRQMLSGEKPLSIRRAVYLAESPYLSHLETPLSYAD